MANIVLNGTIVTVKSLRIGTSSFITYEPISLSWLVLNLWHESNNKVPSEPVDKVKRQIKLSLFKGTFCSSTQPFLGIFMAFENYIFEFLIDSWN